MTTRSCLIRFDINYVSITPDRKGCGYVSCLMGMLQSKFSSTGLASKNCIGKVENGFDIYGTITKQV